MKPRVPITDPAFDYVNSAKTDIRKTFRRVIREQAQIARAKAEQHSRERSKVLPIKGRA